MKRKIIFILLIVGLAATISAQGWGHGKGHPRMPNHGYRRGGPQMNAIPRRPPAAEAVTLSGNLIVARGMPALKSDDVTYLVSGLNRLTGFVDGLKEGAQVTIEGYAFSRQKEDTVKVVKPSKLSLNGKSYDMASPFRGTTPRPEPRMRERQRVTPKQL